ncbi:MAG: EamA family transporter [Pikeienuella sp.]
MAGASRDHHSLEMQLDLYVFLAVLGAAAMHASWNAIVRIGADRFTAMLLMAVGSGVISVPLIIIFPTPTVDAWGWLALSVLFHTGYKLSLLTAYKHGDLSQIYPLARGTAPVLVTGISILFLNEIAPLDDLLAILFIAGGVFFMSFKGGGAGLSRTGLLFAMATACCTAGYTLTDGVGARTGGDPSGYAGWLFFLDGIAMVIIALWMRGRNVLAPIKTHWRSGLLAGGLSLGSYWVAIWAFTLAPIALVGALRETSVLFAMLIAAVFLKEPVGPSRWAAAVLILCGVALLRLEVF